MPRTGQKEADRAHGARSADLFAYLNAACPHGKPDGLLRLRSTKKEARFTRASFFAWPLSGLPEHSSGGLWPSDAEVGEPNPRPPQDARKVRGRGEPGDGIP